MVAILQGPFGPVVLNMPTFTIGQAPDNQLILNDPNVSPRHALIRMETQHVSIMDLGSTNGTYVNEQRLEQNSPRLLSTGDGIRIGNTTFRYEENITAPPAPPFPTIPNRESNPGVPLDAQAKPYGYTDYGQQQGNQPPPFSGYPPPPSYNPNPYGQTWVATEVPGGNPPPNQPSSQLPHQGLQGQPYAPPEQKKTKSQLKILLIALAAFLVLAAGGGIFAYVLTRPQPFISVNSQYQVNMTPTGSTSTEFRVSGHKFSSNSSVTFLLDNSVVPGNPAAQSDNNGDVTTMLTVTQDWPLGDHILKARDASGYTTKDGAALKIVEQGQAHTPSPNGAPADDTTFTINATYLGEGQPAHQRELDIAGHPDPNGGSVCAPGDDGSQYTSNGKDNIGTYIDTYALTCSGTYKGGKLSFTETLSNETYTYTNGVICKEPAPFVYIHLEGTFSNVSNISGSYSDAGETYNCTQGASYQYLAIQGSWTGQVK